MKQFLGIFLMLSLMVTTNCLYPVLLYPTKRSESTETSSTKFSSLPSTPFTDLSFCFWVNFADWTKLC